MFFKMVSYSLLLVLKFFVKWPKNLLGTYSLDHLDDRQRIAALGIDTEQTQL